MKIFLKMSNGTECVLWVEVNGIAVFWAVCFNTDLDQECYKVRESEISLPWPTSTKSSLRKCFFAIAQNTDDMKQKKKKNFLISPNYYFSHTCTHGGKRSHDRPVHAFSAHPNRVKEGLVPPEKSKTGVCPSPESALPPSPDLSHLFRDKEFRLCANGAPADLGWVPLGTRIIVSHVLENRKSAQLQSHKHRPLTILTRQLPGWTMSDLSLMSSLSGK